MLSLSKLKANITHGVVSLKTIFIAAVKYSKNLIFFYYLFSLLYSYAFYVQRKLIASPPLKLQDLFLIYININNSE